MTHRLFIFHFLKISKQLKGMPYFAAHLRKESKKIISFLKALNHLHSKGNAKSAKVALKSKQKIHFICVFSDVEKESKHFIGGGKMRIESFYEKKRDGSESYTSKWTANEEKGCVVLVHGMMEHSLRYEAAGMLLAERGYTLQAQDIRGHGRTALKAKEALTGDFGFLAEKDGFETTVDDIKETVDALRKSTGTKRIILAGHSFGSFLVQRYIQKYGETIDKCVLLGSGCTLKRRLRLALNISRLFRKFFGERARSKLLMRIIFHGFNKRIVHAKTPVDWLARNEDAVSLYMQDELCGKVPTASFFCDMMEGMLKVQDEKEVEKVPPALPVLLLSGSEDPVGEYGAGVKRLEKLYRDSGKNVSSFIYEGCRHELLNETVRADVFDKVIL